jgi:hypothetical protein
MPLKIGHSQKIGKRLAAGGHLAGFEAKVAAQYGPEPVPPEPPIDLADPQYDEPHEPRLELVEFGGESTDIDWMTFNHDTGEALIQFLEHGKPGRLYSYPNLPYEEFEALISGAGVYPALRDPRYYQKEASTGQRVNFYLRNDQRDDLHEYEQHS